MALAYFDPDPGGFLRTWSEAVRNSTRVDEKIQVAPLFLLVSLFSNMARSAQKLSRRGEVLYLYS